MKNKTLQAVILLLVGLILIGAGLYIYFVANTIYPDAGSSRVQDLNRLLKFFGKGGTAALFSMTGLVFTWLGIRKLKQEPM